jgi:hypothetical protein
MLPDDDVVSYSEHCFLPDDIVVDAHADWLESIGQEGLAHIRRFVRAHATGKDVPHESLYHVVRGLNQTLTGIVELQKAGKDQSKARGLLIVDALGLNQPRGRRRKPHQHAGDVLSSPAYLLARDVLEYQVKGMTKSDAVSTVLHERQLKGQETTLQTIYAAYNEYRRTAVVQIEYELYANQEEPLLERNRKRVTEAVEDFLLQQSIAENKLKLKLLERLALRLDMKTRLTFLVLVDNLTYPLSFIPSQCGEMLDDWVGLHLEEVLCIMLEPEDWIGEISFDFNEFVKENPVKIAHAAIIALEKI